MTAIETTHGQLRPGDKFANGWVVRNVVVWDSTAIVTVHRPANGNVTYRIFAATRTVVDRAHLLVTAGQ